MGHHRIGCDNKIETADGTRGFGNGDVPPVGLVERRAPGREVQRGGATLQPGKFQVRYAIQEPEALERDRALRPPGAGSPDKPDAELVRNPSRGVGNTKIRYIGWNGFERHSKCVWHFHQFDL